MEKTTGNGSSTRKRVLSPVTGKDGKTYWMRLGTAWVNKDQSINVYLDCFPVNGKLQVRDWDEPRRDGQRDILDSPTPLEIRDHTGF